MSHSTQDDEGAGDGAMESIQLTSEELKFRAELFEAAKRLDVPSPIGEQRLFARFNVQESLQSAPWLRRLVDSRRPTIWAITSIAAAAALYGWAKQGIRTEARLTHSEQVTPETRADVTVPKESVKPTASEDTATRAAPKKHAKLASHESQAKPKTANDQATMAAPESNTKPPVPGDQAEIVAPENQSEPATSPIAAATDSRAGRLIVWDGDSAGFGANGWSGPDSKKKVIAARPNVGFGNSVGLEWQASGAQWMGFGWNWYSWYPRNAGTDISDYNALAFKLKIIAKVPADYPTPRGLLVSLSSSGGSGKRSSATVNLETYAPPALNDGEWHEIAVPLEALWGKGSNGFDRTSVWEVDIGHWSTESRTFTAYIDDIGFEKTSH